MPVFEWFLNEYRLIDPPKMRNVDTDKFAEYLSNKKIKNQILAFVKITDPSISDIVVEARVDEDEPNTLYDIPKEKYRVIFIHHDKRLGLSQQGDGTKKFMEFVIPWMDSLIVGGLIIIDKMSDSLHPLLSRFLIELICNPEINKANAQLIFSAHDTSLLDNELLRRDQIWFVEKDENNATHLYSLTDFSPRKQEAFGKAYLHGRYGALPYIDEWGLELH